MMCSYNKKKLLVNALDSNKEEGPFFCNFCSTETILKKGLYKRHHFSHKNIVYCEKNNESIEHYNAKYDIFKKLKILHPEKVYVEYNKMQGIVSDVYVDTLKPFAFEIQISNIDEQKIKERTIKYQDNKCEVYWIFLENKLKIKKVFNKNYKYIIHLNQMQKYASEYYRPPEKDSHKGRIYLFNKKTKELKEMWVGFYGYKGYHKDLRNGKIRKQIINQREIFK